MRARILAIPYGHALSHVSRPLVVAEELRRRGHDVVFAGGGKELAHVRRKGFEVREIFELPHEVLFGRIRDRRLRFVETDEVARLVDADRAAIADVGPDLVLSDGRISARLSTLDAGVRHAAIVNVSSTRYRAVPYVPFFSWVPSEPLRRAAIPLNLWFEMALFDRVVPAFRRVADRLGVPPIATATDCLEGNDLTLLPDLPEFMPTRNRPTNHVYIGPLTFKADFPRPAWWPRLVEAKRVGRTVVYFTLGTTGTRELFHSALRAFSVRPDLAVVISTGGQVELPTLPENLYVCAYVDGDEVMELADLVVCHGGNGTIYQDMPYAVPLIGIPTVPDQAYNMRQAEALGVGRTWRKPLDGAFLDEALRWAHVARDKARQTELREKIAGFENGRVGVDEIERLCARPERGAP